MLTAQQIFDKVVTHLFTQGEPSIEGQSGSARCAYRGDGGKMCAVGCLIPDEYYRPEFDDNQALRSIVHEFPGKLSRALVDNYIDITVTSLSNYIPFKEALAAGGVDVDQHRVLLDALQDVHDLYCNPYSNVTARWLVTVANNFSLSPEHVRFIEE